MSVHFYGDVLTTVVRAGSVSAATALYYKRFDFKISFMFYAFIPLYLSYSMSYFYLSGYHQKMCYYNPFALDYTIHFLCTHTRSRFRGHVLFALELDILFKRFPLVCRLISLPPSRVGLDPPRKLNVYRSIKRSPGEFQAFSQPVPLCLYQSRHPPSDPKVEFSNVSVSKLILYSIPLCIVNYIITFLAVEVIHLPHISTNANLSLCSSLKYTFILAPFIFMFCSCRYFKILCITIQSISFFACNLYSIHYIRYSLKQLRKHFLISVRSYRFTALLHQPHVPDVKDKIPI